MKRSIYLQIIWCFATMIIITSCNQNKQEYNFETEDDIIEVVDESVLPMDYPSKWEESYYFTNDSRMTRICTWLYGIYYAKYYEDNYSIPDVRSFVPSILEEMDAYASNQQVATVTDLKSLDAITDIIENYLSEKAETTWDMKATDWFIESAQYFRNDYCKYKLGEAVNKYPELKQAIFAVDKARQNWIDDEKEMFWECFVCGSGGGGGSGGTLGMGSFESDLISLNPIVHFYEVICYGSYSKKYKPLRSKSAINDEYNTILNAVVEMERDEGFEFGHLPSSSEKKKYIVQAQNSWGKYMKAFDELINTFPEEKRQQFRDIKGIDQRIHLVCLKNRYNFGEMGITDGSKSFAELGYDDTEETIVNYQYPRDYKWNITSLY